MPIPPFDRVKYQKNTLAEVICQVRFPRVLKITTSPPAGFQERVRAEYPLFDQRIESALPFTLGAGGSPEAPIYGSTTTSYDFHTLDRNWQITLTGDFLALSTRKYDRWEGFRARMTEALDVLVSEYDPAVIVRLGLRYQNLIVPSTLGLAGVPWTELLSGSALGELSNPHLAADVTELRREALLSLQQYNGKVRVRNALLKEESTGEQCFLVDCDFFTDTATPIASVIPTLNYLNENSRNLFRQYVATRLHNAMDPLSLS